MATRKKPAAAPTGEVMLIDGVPRSEPLVPDESWTFRHNDNPVTFAELKKIEEDHIKWADEQERLAELTADPEPKKKTRKKK